MYVHMYTDTDRIVAYPDYVIAAIAFWTIGSVTFCRTFGGWAVCHYKLKSGTFFFLFFFLFQTHVRPTNYYCYSLILYRKFFFTFFFYYDVHRLSPISRYLRLEADAISPSFVWPHVEDDYVNSARINHLFLSPPIIKELD